MKQYPPFPRGREDIFAYTGPGEYLASAIVKDYSIRQLMAFRKLRLALGEANFREALIETLLLIARYRNNREEILKYMPKPTYFRHRNELTGFFVIL